MNRHEPRPSSPPGSARARWAGAGLRGARLFVLAYVGLCAVLYALQSRLIFPGSATRGLPEAVVRPRPGTDLVALRTRGGDRVVALFGPALNADGSPLPDAPRRPTILFFYGNGMCLRAAESVFERLRRAGANVLIPEYVGYGMSGGRPGEAGCLATADAAYEHLKSRPDVDPSRIVAAGWSLGGAVAIDLAAREPVAGLFVLSTFTSLADMARRSFPFVPTSLLLAHRFESLEKIGRVTCPILIGHGRGDRVVPYEMSGRLESAAKAPARRFLIDGADHNDLFEVGWPLIRAELLPFLDRVARPGAGGG